MRKLMFAVLAFASLPALASNWVVVRDTPIETTFADTDSISWVNDGAFKQRVWIITKAKSGDERATRVFVEVRCPESRVRYLQVDYFVGGALKASGVPEKAGEWRYAPPDSEEEAAMKAACKKR